ncbi:MAG: hypothetical protein CMB49_04895, partial [Euryarchaeota archaeon]|nr:hypothetical protein [Euryarchaeota archaeon]
STLENIAICTVKNPTVHQEKISIEIQSGIIESSGPSSITLDPNSEEEFQISLRAQSRMPEGSHSLKVTATVQEVNGVDSTTNATSSSSMIISILQFSGINVEVVEPSVMVEASDTVYLEYYVHNMGNAGDRFRIELRPSESLLFEGAELSLPLVSIQVDVGTPEKIRVKLTAPINSLGWPVNSNGEHTISHWFDVRVTSDFSCRNEEICLFMDAHQEVTFFENQTIEVEEEGKLTKNSESNQIVEYIGAGAGVILFVLCLILLRKRS